MGEDADGAAVAPVKRVDFAGIHALSSRQAGYAVALKCLQVQAAAEAADPTLKTDDGVRLHPAAWPWYQGAVGERQVGELLTGLGPEWFVRHSVPIGAGTKDVDHLVIGPGGVFAINTKHHAQASVWVGDHVLRINNANTTHLKAAVRDASEVSRRLSDKAGFPTSVTPVVAILNARSLADRRAPHDRTVQVVDAHRLVSWLRAQAPQLSAAKIDLLKLAAEEPGTWHVDPRAADTYRVMQRFERLVARVSQPAAHTSPIVAAPRSHSAPRPPAPPRASRAARTRKAVWPDVLATWVVTAAALIGMLLFRSLAQHPCAPSATCVLPTFYRVWRPFFPWAAVVLVARALVVTGLRTARARRRARKR